MSPETVETLIRGYGYPVILFGTYFDHYGIPLFLVFGGLAASQHLLNIYAVAFCGFAGGWIADLFLYFLGYKTGLQYWMRFAFVRRLEEPIRQTGRLFQTRPAAMVILGRFLFAVSKIIPPFAGMIRYDAVRYVIYSFIGNILFSAAYSWASFSLGPAILESLKSFKAANLVLTAAFVAILFWLGGRLARNRS